MLLVARGESETLIIRLRVGPDLTLYMDEAGIFVINGLKLLGTVRLISICLIAISKDFFESDLPKPELSGDDDFPDKLLRGDCLSSCIGGTNLRIFITLSTIFVPYDPGLTLSLALAYARFNEGTGTEVPLLRLTPLGSRPLEGEHDCLLTLPLGTGSIDDDRLLGAPARPLIDAIGLSVSEVRKFGGASRV